jgi:hypothetical protein
MHDWLAYVKEHLRLLPDTCAVDEEVLHELAGHLEERYRALLAQGLAEQEALRQTCSEVGGWIELHEGILSAKEGIMQNRVRQLWIPGLVTLFGSAGLLTILELAGVRPLIFHPSPQDALFPRPYDPSSLIFYVPWLASLPILGALGAFLAGRAKAPNLATHLSSTFPAVVMGVVMSIVFVGALFLDRPVSLQIKTIGFFAACLNWVVIPGMALLLGDLVLQWMLKRRWIS